MLKQNLFTTCIYFILLVGCNFSFLKAQNSINSNKIIKGKTIHAITQEPIGFVNLGVGGTTIGTASDSKGEFSLSIPQTQYNQFDLFYSAIGYKSGQIALKLISTDSVHIFELEPTQYKLNELDVNAKSKVAVGIIKDAVAQIPVNYPSFPFSYAFLYKAEKEYNEKSAAVSSKGIMYDSLGYVAKNFQTTYASRSYIFTEPTETETTKFAFNKGITAMDALLEFDIVGSKGNVLSIDQLSKYKLTLMGLTTYQQDSVYVIAYKNLSPSVTSTGDYYVTSYEGEIYISKSTKAILKNTTQVKSSQVSLYGRGLAIPEGMYPIGKEVIYEFSTTYNYVNNLYQLGTISLEITYLNSSKDKVVSKSQLIIEGLNKESAKEIPLRDVLKSGK